MRRRPSSHSPISLFTFLDTLVCTMGSLILMLLAMTPKLRERAEARAEVRDNVAIVAQDSDVAAAYAPAVDEIDHAAERDKRRAGWLNSLAEARAALETRQADLRRQRQLLKNAGREFQDIMDQILKARLKRESLTDASQSLSERETRLAEHEARIAQKIAMARKNIDLLDRKQATAANEFALVPYDGSSGTVRRPIYIECSKKGFRFLPEDEALSPADIKGFPLHYNPLLTGTQSLVRFWSRRRRDLGGDEPEPYVLLLVRPSGINTYYEARTYLAGLDVNFGYELIEEDWKLRYPDADPLAKTILKQTLDITVQSHGHALDAMADAAQRGGTGGGRRFFGDDRRGGWSDGMPGEDGLEDVDGMPFGSASRGNGQPSVRFNPPARPSRAPKGGNPNSEIGDNLTGTAGTERGIASRSGARGGSASGSSSRIGSGSGGDVGSGTSAAKGGAVAGKTGSARPGHIGGGTNSGLGGTGGGTFGAESDEGGFGELPGVGSGTQTGTRRSAGGNPGSAAGGDSGLELNGEPGAVTSDKPSRGSKGSSSSGGGGAKPGGKATRPASLNGSGPDAGDSSGDADVPLELPSDYVPGKLPDGGDGSGGSGDGSLQLKSLPRDPNAVPGKGSGGIGGDSVPLAGGASIGKSKSGSPSPGSAAAGAVADSGQPASGSVTGSADSGSASADAASGAMSPDGSSLGKVQMGGPGGSLRLGSAPRQKPDEKDEDPNAGPRVAQDDGAQNGPRMRARGPRLWGTAGPKASIGLERKLEVRVLADRILIGSKDNVVRVGNGETTDVMIKHVVAGIEQTAENWGTPPSSYFWLPTVRFVIYPGGNQYYERLHGPLESEWGVPSTMEYAPEKKPASKKTATGGRP